MTLESTLCPSASFSADMIPQLIVFTVTWGFHDQSHSWIPAEAFPASGSTTPYPPPPPHYLEAHQMLHPLGHNL